MKLRFPLSILGVIAFGLSAFAQPSGGPYGPVAQHYEVPTAGTVYFVAPDGLATEEGSALAAPTTLASAIARAVTDDIIVLRGGTYRTGGLRLSQGVTMQPFESERPVIKGTEVAENWERVQEGLWRTKWTKLFPAAPADWWRANENNLKASPLYMFNNDMVFLEGEMLQTVGEPSDVTEGTYCIDYPGGWVYVGIDPTERLIEITAHNSAITRTLRNAHGKPNDGKGMTIRGITFTQYARLALLVEGIEPGAKMDPSEFGKEIVGTTLEHLTISHCSRVAGYFRGDGLTIRHCLVSDCGTEGIYVINSADVLLERNIITRINTPENLVGYYATAVKIFNQSYNVVCRDNLVIDNPNANGIWYDVGNVDGVFINNWVETTPSGFFFEISKGAICAGNVFVNCGIGLRALNSSEVQIYQNTFYNSEAAIQRNDRSHKAGDHFGWHTSAGPDVVEREGHVFVNNLMVGDEDFDRPLLGLWQHERVKELLREPQVAGLDGNVYVRRSGGEGKPLILWGPADTDNGLVDLHALEELHARHPTFARSAQAYAEYFGPLFQGEHLQRFELLSEFPGAKVSEQTPAAVLKLLGWKEAGFPGAYAPVE